MDFLNGLFKKESGKVRIEVENLIIRHGAKTVIDGLSFKVDRGQVYGIIGMSGAGKSTILKAITGQIMKTGMVKLEGKYGYCPQDDAFFQELTVKENIRLFGSLNGVQERKALERGIELLKELMIDDKLESPAGTLSGGQKKRLNIILSILHEPRILLLDEPHSGLDYYNRKILWDFLTHLKNKGYTIVLTTHLLNEAEEYCSEVLVLRNGKKFAAGSVRQILSRRGVDEIISLKTNYLNKEKEEDIHTFCKRNKVRVLELKKNSLIVGLSGAEKARFYDYLKKERVEFEELFARKPDLDDVFLMSVKNV